MQKDKKILLACPIHSRKRYIIKEYVKNIKVLEGIDDICLADNSDTEDFSVYIEQELNQSVMRNRNAGKHSRQRQCYSLNKIRDVFLAGNWDYLFLLESDIIPNGDIVKHLLEHDKDIVSAVYMLGDKKKLPCLTINKFIANKGGWTNMFVNESFVDGELKKVENGAGIGCVLIKRKVMQKIKFRWASQHADTYFWEDLRAYGFKGFVDTSQIVKHYPNEISESDF